MKVLITGAGGFLGQNLREAMDAAGGFEPLCAGRDTPRQKLAEMAARCDAVVHLAGVNRPESPGEFDRVNRGYTQELLELLRIRESPPPVVYSSSVQAGLDNAYGKSKRAAEELLLRYSRETGAPVYIFRLPNLFGKWGRPDYNSVVATFCYRLARRLPIAVTDPRRALTLCHVDHVTEAFISALRGEVTGPYCRVEGSFVLRLGNLARILRRFAGGGIHMPALDTPPMRELYSTYISYLPRHKLLKGLRLHSDARGTLFEFMKSPSGQIFISRTLPGITRGNHRHSQKTEQFLVLEGKALIRLRRYGDNRVLEFRVRGELPRVVRIPPGYTHSITNTGEGTLITLFWSSHLHDPKRPDTVYEEV